MQTTKLNNGLTVLAHTDRHGYFGAWQAVNNARAIKKVAELQAAGLTAWVLHRGVCRYIVIEA